MKTRFGLGAALVVSLVQSSLAFAAPVILCQGVLKDKTGGKPVEKVLIKVYEVGTDKNSCTTKTTSEGKITCILAPGKLYVVEMKQDFKTIGYATIVTPNVNQYQEITPEFTVDALSPSRSEAEIASFELGEMKNEKEVARLSSLVQSLKSGDDYRAPIRIQYPKTLGDGEVAELKAIVNQSFGDSKKVQVEPASGASTSTDNKIHVRIDTK